MDKIDEASITELENDGRLIYEQNKETIETFIKTILDEKYGQV